MTEEPSTDNFHFAHGFMCGVLFALVIVTIVIFVKSAYTP